MDIKEYEEFCKNSKYGNFMQSADWAKVKKGWIPEYVAVRDERGKINGCDYGQGEQSADDIFCGFFKVKFHLQNPHFPQNYRQGLP